MFDTLSLTGHLYAYRVHCSAKLFNLALLLIGDRTVFIVQDTLLRCSATERVQLLSMPCGQGLQLVDAFRRLSADALLFLMECLSKSIKLVSARFLRVEAYCEAVLSLTKIAQV